MRCAKRADQAPEASALCKVHWPSILNLKANATVQSEQAINLKPKANATVQSEQAKNKEFQNGTRNRNQQRSS